MAFHMKQPLVSVLMPVYNAEKYIASSLKSVFNSYGDNYELVIIDDGSKDSTKDIINKFNREKLNIRYFYKSNSGIADSLNFGLSMSNGQWIARLDSDDLCQPNRFRKQLELVQKSPKIGLVGSAALFIDSNDNNLYKYHYPESHKELVNNLLNSKAFFPHSSAFFNKQLVEYIGGYRVRLTGSEDWDLWLRISEHAEIKCLNIPLVKIRLHENQLTKNDFELKQTFYDSKAAIVCYWLRKNKEIDPVTDFSEKDFILFKSFIFKKLADSYLDQYIYFINKIKNPSIKRIILPFLILKFLLRPKVIFWFIKHKFFSKNVIFGFAKSFFTYHSKKYNL